MRTQFYSLVRTSEKVCTEELRIALRSFQSDSQAVIIDDINAGVAPEFSDGRLTLLTNCFSLSDGGLGCFDGRGYSPPSPTLAPPI